MSEPRNATSIDLVDLLEMSHQDYLDRFRGTAIRRAKHWMLQRNAAVALGNTGEVEALPALNRALSTNPHPIVRGHAAWAVGKIGVRAGSEEGERILRSARLTEEDPSVLEEIDAALQEMEAQRQSANLASHEPTGPR